MLYQIARKARQKLREYRAHTLWRMGVLKTGWTSSLADELNFWEKALKDQGKGWNQQEFRERTDPDLPLQEELKTLIHAPEGTVVRIIDVGAGPLTRVGRIWKERRVEIVPVDALAEQYASLLARLSITSPVKTIAGHGEDLLANFSENQFDLAYSSNALDHSYDPLRAIRQMLAVVKPSCYVYLWHFANAGLQEGYHGLHQWNFDIRKGEFMIGGRDKTYSLSSEFAQQAEVQCEILHAFNTKVVVAKLKKLEQAQRA
jgi:SAM-dependent methyltransferase